MSIRQIARGLGRHPSTVSREIRRGRWCPANTSAAYVPYRPGRVRTDGWTSVQYRAGRAQSKADKRALASHQPSRMATDQMVDFVVDRLRRGWSPQMICGRLSREHPDEASKRVSPETVYAWIYSPAQKHRRLWEYLPRGQKKRRKRSGRRVHSSRIERRTSIRHRPAACQDRTQFGHWEGDTIIGARGGTALHTEVERLTRFLTARKIEAVTCDQTIAAQLDIFAPLTANARRSTTTDNGTEFHHHWKLTDQLGIDTFFADPYSAWQRGTNEHFNGRIRRYLPKGTNLDALTRDELDAIIEEINNQPHKVLNWATPAEAFTEQLESLQTTPCCTSD